MGVSVDGSSSFEEYVVVVVEEFPPESSVVAFQSAIRCYGESTPGSEGSPNLEIIANLSIGRKQSFLGGVGKIPEVLAEGGVGGWRVGWKRWEREGSV